ncbi:MAG: pseudouridine synthase [Treponema sp.]|nr:pseudouridine synthase [Treponema sp.]
MDNNPYILDETDDFAVVYKPPKMHCVPVSKNNEHPAVNTIFEWFTENSAVVYDLVHRLDYETHGLVLIAKNEKSFNFFKTLQDNGEFIKEYSAVCVPDNTNNIEGFPDHKINIQDMKPSAGKPLIIMSYFRPYGPGRKQVRPVIDAQKKGMEVAKDTNGFYKTEIVNVNNNIFTARIKRGFRHQIRCHLSWIGYPIQNDPLYSNGAFAANPLLFSDSLALRAHALFFIDPANGRSREYCISKIQHLGVK